MQLTNLDLLKELCLTPGAPGHEGAIRAVVLREVQSLADQIEIDNMGNVIAFKKGRTTRKAMVAAHMDEISFIITHVDKNGFARFIPLGGFDPKTLTAQRVIVHGKEDLLGVMGSKPIHLMSPEERAKPPRIQDYFIDFGLPADKVLELVEIGNVATRERDLIDLGPSITTKSLDNRISVYILIECLKRMGTPAYDFYAVFTVQEEVGLRGATPVSRRINPDIGIGLDVTIANDLPDVAEHEKITTLGGGAAIKIMDGSVISDIRLVRFMEEVAKKYAIPFQKEILPAGGTDTGALQRSGEGAVAGCISIPTRHIHSVVEMCSKTDIEASIELLRRCLENLDGFDHSWS